MDFWLWVRSVLGNALGRPTPLGSEKNPVMLPTMHVVGRKSPLTLQQQLMQYQESPLLQDSITQLLGFRPSVNVRGDIGNEVSVAAVHPASPKTIEINEDWLRRGTIPAGYRSVRDIMLHETGHSYHETHPEALRLLTQDYGQERIENWSSYAASSPEEHAGTVFNQAMNKLQATRANKDLAWQVFETADQSTRGVQTMMRILLREPIFANHPLNRGR